MFQKIINYSIHNKIVILAATLGLIIWGGFSLSKLPIDAIPDVTNNQVVILTQSPTLAAQEVEQYITIPIELKVANLQGVTEVRSISRQGLSVITLVFEESVGMYLARQMVTEQLKTTEDEIPAEYGKPELAPITTGLGEIYQYTLKTKPGYQSSFSLTELRTIQDWVVKRQLSGIPGVIEVSSFGGFVKQYEVSVKPNLLKSNGLSLLEVNNALLENNSNTGGSYLERHDQAFFIRGEGRVSELNDIANIHIKTTNGIPITVGDVAEVKIGHAPRFGAMTRDGESEAVGAVVLMLKGADSEHTIRGVKDRIKRIQKTLPEGIYIEPFIDRTKLINKAVSTVRNNLIEGGLIVVLILILLMGSIRAGLIVASVIPISMLITFALMKVFGISANLMSLGALDFGLLVDCSVIVVEAVLVKLHLDKKSLITNKKMDNLVATESSKVLSSALFGGLIILIVYLPILSLTGIEGKMFKPMASTVSLAILTALVLSMTYVPVMASLLLRKEGQKPFKLSSKIVDTIFNAYLPLLQKALKWPKTTLGIALILFVSSLFIFSNLGGEFIPTLDEGDIAVDFQTPPGSSLNTTIEATLEAQRALKSKFPEILQIVGRIGASEVPTDPMPVEASDLMINMKDKSEWVTASNREEMVEKMAAVLESEVPGSSAEFTQPIQMRFNEMIAGAKSEIVVKIVGEDLEVLSQKADECESLLKKIEGVASVKVERIDGLPQIQVKYNHQKVARYALSISELNKSLKTAYAGETVGVIFEKDRRFDLVVRLDESYRKKIEDIRNLPVKLEDGSFINFSEIASVAYVNAPTQISRDDTKRRIDIGIGILNRDVESIVSDIQNSVEAQVELPPGYYFEYGGAFENLQEATSRLLIALPIALLLIFVLLFLAFNSAKNALLIFTAIPLSSIGGIVALWLRGMPFSISAGIGFIALFGVAVLNGVVLFSYFNNMKSAKMGSVKELILTGVQARFRPVLLTAMVASFGFLPMALSQSAGAEVQKPLATVVIGGLITATLLTLVVLPVLYKLFNTQSQSQDEV